MASNSKAIIGKNTTNDNVDEIVFRGIISVIEKQSKGTWVGTITNLKSNLNRVLNRNQKTNLPGSPAALRVVINRVVNRLRNRGIGVKFGRTTDHSRTRFVRFAR